jgi:NTP pyrophosphatase (non-canonical NTP hydrolase)
MEMKIDAVQEVAYVNAVRRGFWREGYEIREAIAHLKMEIDELEEAIEGGDREEITLETGDILLICMTMLYHRGIRMSDALVRVINKELLREGHSDGV